MTTLNRRQVLSASALAALGLAAGRGDAANGQSVVRMSRQPAVPPARAPYKPAGPYSLVAHSNLSQDYFITTEVTAELPFNTGVLPVVRSDGSQVILVVPSTGRLIMVAPDPASPSGFLAMHLPPIPELVAGGLVAAASGPDNTIEIAFKANYAGVRTLVIRPDGTYSSAASLGSRALIAGAPKIARDSAGRAHTLGFQGDGRSAGLVVKPVGDPGQGTRTPIVGTVPSGVPDVQFAITQSGGSDTLVALTLADKKLGLMVGPLKGASSYDHRDIALPPDVGINGLLCQPIPLSLQGNPDVVAAVAWYDAGQVIVSTVSRAGELLSSPFPMLSEERFGIQAQIQSMSWYLDETRPGTVTAFVLTFGGTLWKQSIDFEASVPDRAPIPLDTGVTHMNAPSVGSSSDSFLAIARRSTDVVGEFTIGQLSRRGDGEWRTYALHTTAQTHSEIKTYRTLLTVVDPSGIPVPDVSVFITPDVDLVAFRSTGGLVLRRGIESSLTTDAWGQVCLAQPAVSLTAGAMTIQCASGSGSGRSVAIDVRPDEEVHQFLAGMTQLNQYTAVADFVKDPSHGLFPAISRDVQSADAITQAISSAALAGLMPKAAPGAASTPQGLQPFRLSGLNTAKPSLTTGVAIPRNPARASQPSWWVELAEDINSVWHAIERGAAKVVEVVTGWDAAAKEWFVRLSLQLADGASLILDYAIDGVRSAIAAVQGIMQAVGAAIEDAVDALSAFIDGTMADATAIADRLYSWISYDPAKPGNAGLAVVRNSYMDFLSDLEASSTGFFKGLESDLRAQIEAISPLVGNFSLGGGPLKADKLPPKFDAARNPLQNSRVTWLMEKVRSAPITTSSTSPFAASPTTMGLAKILGDALGGSIALGKNVADAVPPIDSPSDFLDLDIVALLQVLLEALAEGLEVLDLVITDILEAMRSLVDDLNALIRFNLDDVPIIGDLLALFGLEGLSIGRLFCLIIGFAMSVVGGLAFGGKQWLPASVAAQAVAPSPLQRRGAKLHALPASSSPEAVAAPGGGSWKEFLTIARIVVGALSAVPLSFTVIEVLSGEEEVAPNPFIEALEIVFSCTEFLLYFPWAEGVLEDVSNLSADIEWKAAEYEDEPGLALGVWMMGLVPVILNYVGTVASLGPGEVAAGGVAGSLTYRTVVLPFVTSAVGVAGLCVGLATKFSESEDGEDEGELVNARILDVLRWTPRILYVLVPVPEINAIWAIAAASCLTGAVALESVELAGLVNERENEQA